MINLEDLREEPFSSILCYPKTSEIELEVRLKELAELDIKALQFCGNRHVFNIPVLGKGCIGIVVLAIRDCGKAALKIQRVDAGYGRIEHEAEMLGKANSVGVGPEVLGVSENFLLMQFIEGALIPEWLKYHEHTSEIEVLLRHVLEQCWRLDQAGLDHGELSHAPKHIIVTKKNKPFIVDFETASTNRKPSNVTSICQFLFISGIVAENVAKNLRGKGKKMIIEALKHYKKDKTRGNFEKIFVACGL